MLSRENSVSSFVAMRRNEFLYANENKHKEIISITRNYSIRSIFKNETICLYYY